MNWLSINYPCADSAARFRYISRKDRSLAVSAQATVRLWSQSLVSSGEVGFQWTFNLSLAASKKLKAVPGILLVSLSILSLSGTVTARFNCDPLLLFSVID